MPKPCSILYFGPFSSNYDLPPPLALSKYASPPSIYQNMIHPPTPFIKLCPPRLKFFTLTDFCWQSFVLFSWWTNLHSEIERSISVSTEFVKNNNIFAMFCNFCTREVVVISRNHVDHRNLVKNNSFCLIYKMIFIITLTVRYDKCLTHTLHMRLEAKKIYFHSE